MKYIIRQYIESNKKKEVIKERTVDVLATALSYLGHRIHNSLEIWDLVVLDESTFQSIQEHHIEIQMAVNPKSWKTNRDRKMMIFSIDEVES